ncbi:MAG: hypothetical protein LBE21_05915 [Pseudomonadales bacterium]|jgi:hypothetical protein|nr:hypothetical protein [Pseudomonadales bacterium]
MLPLSRLRLSGLSLLTLLFSSAALAQDCDRACLDATLNTYLTALIAHDPSQAPLASTYRHTENDIVMPLGTGMWQSATGLGAVQRHYLDPVSGNAVYYGIIDEGAEQAIVAIRLHVQDRTVNEAEWWVGRPSDPGVDGTPGGTLWDAEYLTNGNPPLIREVPEAERSTREELIYITNSYWDYVVNRNPAIAVAHPGCFREENGRRTVGNPLPANRADDGGLNGQSDCRSGSSTFNVLNVTARRWHVVDVEQQVVIASALFIREPGNAKRRNHFCDVFYIDGGKLRGIYTAMYYVDPLRAVPNWPPFEGNFPLAADFGPTK